MIEGGGIKAYAWFDRDDYDGDNGLFYDKTGDESLEVEFDASGLEAGDTLRINLEAWGLGYEWGQEELYIPVIAEVSDDVTMTPEKTEVLVNEAVEFTVDAGENNIAAVRFFGGKSYWDEEWLNEDERDTSHTLEASLDEAGTWQVFAEVLLEDNIGDEEEETEDVWLTTAPVAMTAISKGAAGDFDIKTVNGDEVGDDDPGIEVARGNLVTVTYTESENADNYWVDVDKWYTDEEDEDNGWWDWFDHYADTSALSAGFGTADLEEGLYRVRVLASGKGYENAEAGHVIYLTVTDGSGDNDLSFNVSKTELYTAEDFAFSVYCKGASRIDLVCENVGEKYIEWDDDRDGASFQNTDAFFNSGTYKLTATAYAYNEDTEKESTISSHSITMKVTAPKGSLTVEAPELPEEHPACTDLTFTVSSPENASGCRVIVYYKDADDSDNWNILVWKRGGKDGLNVTVPAKKLQAGSTLWFNVGAWGIGYEFTENEEAAVALKAHDLNAAAAKDATCEETGNTAYWTCTGCGKYFSDEAGVTEIEEGSWITEATGHDWGEPTYTWSEDNSSVTAARTCKNDSGHVETETVETTYTVTDSTCTEAGNRHYTTKAFSNTAFSVQEKDAAISAKGHTAAAAVKENGVAAACTEAGSYDEVVYCTVCGAEISRTSKTIAALGHSWDSGTVTTEATEEAAGVRTYTCSRCGATRTEDIPQIVYAVTLPKVSISKPAAGKKKMTVKWKKISTKNQKKIDGIEIQYIDNDVVKTVTASKKKTSKVIKKLTSKSKVKVRVRSYKGSGDAKVVSKWSGWKTVKIK